MTFPLISGVLIVLTHQYNRVLCQQRYSKNGQGLIAVPTDIPTYTTEVSLYSNRITEIKTRAFNRLSALTLLNLHDNLISELEPGAFNGLMALSELYLGFNRLRKLEPGIFNEINVSYPFISVQQSYR